METLGAVEVGRELALEKWVIQQDRDGPRLSGEKKLLSLC